MLGLLSSAESSMNDFSWCAGGKHKLVSSVIGLWILDHNYSFHLHWQIKWNTWCTSDNELHLKQDGLHFILHTILPHAEVGYAKISATCSKCNIHNRCFLIGFISQVRKNRMRWHFILFFSETTSLAITGRSIFLTHC